MAYSELVKNFNRIRDYMRDFYVYGFRSREQYTRKSLRSYDDERRRLESWLGDYMKFHQTAEGKNVFLSIDTRFSKHNPLYKAWKTKSFTDGDIVLHFYLMDMLQTAETPLNIKEIQDFLQRYNSEFQNQREFEESTVRKKLQEYVREGIVIGEKRGKMMYYSICSDYLPDLETVYENNQYDAVHFFSEVAPCGVVGSYLLDKIEWQMTKANKKNHLAFKHHYITSALDSEILYDIFLAMRERKSITMEMINRKKEHICEHEVVPVKVMISVQSGRQYLMGYVPRTKKIVPFRMDYILAVKTECTSSRFSDIQKKFQNMLPHLWGISPKSFSKERLEHVEFIIHYEDNEQYIFRRLEREKRCGHVTKIDANTCKFEADVYDAREMIPWIRTFICRIADIHFSNQQLEKLFWDDVDKMYDMYGLATSGSEENV